MTRSKKILDTYLIEEASPFKSDKLPKNIDVLKELIHQQNGSKNKLKVFIKPVIKKVMDTWNTAGIPTLTLSTCLQRLIKLHQQWKKIKYINDDSEMKEKKEEEFKAILNELFDICPKNIANLIDKDEMEFLIDQRSDKPTRVIKDIQKIQKSKKIVKTDDSNKMTSTRGQKRKLVEASSKQKNKPVASSGSPKDDDSSSIASAEPETPNSADESSDGPSESKKLRLLKPSEE